MEKGAFVHRANPAKQVNHALFRDLP
jgi:hypothetical protein